MSYLVSMKKALFSFALTVGVLVGCGGKPAQTVSDMIPGAEAPGAAYVTLHMDTDFTPEERADAAMAADAWGKQTNGLANITLVYDLDFADIIGIRWHFVNGDNMVVRRTSDMEQVRLSDEEADCQACVLGWMAPGSGIHNPWHKPIIGAFVVDRLDGVREQVMLHEFGHVLGVPHIAPVQAIMYPSVVRGRTACLKRADLAAFCSVNECGSVKLFPCE